MDLVKICYHKSVSFYYETVSLKQINDGLLILQCCQVYYSLESGSIVTDIQSERSTYKLKLLSELNN